MPAMAQDTARRGRKDHVLPQGYLDGFRSPSRGNRLSVFDRHKGTWFEPRSTRRIGWIRGFYDYPPGSQPDETADQAFSGLEARFSTVDRKLVANRFSNWREHLNFLLHFAQMLRARSELFRQEDMAYSRSQAMFTITDLLPGNQWSLRPFQPADLREYETLLRNKAITDMRWEIGRGSAWLREIDWCLRFTGDPTDPVITADNPIVVHGRAPTLEDALRDSETLVFFPICWQACLIGSTAKFDKETYPFHQSELKRLRRIYLESARRFTYSPVRLDFDHAEQQI